MFLQLILLFLAVKSVKTDKGIVPLFLLDYDGVMNHIMVDNNPFAKTGSVYFSGIIHDSIKRSEVVIIFVEEHFCMEDISVKDKLGTPYHHLHRGLLDHKVKFFPAVVEPIKHLNKFFTPQQFNIFYLSSGTKLQMFDGHFKYFYVFFQDGKNETRAEVLRRHDLIMREVYFVIRQLSPAAIVAFYTGKMNPVQVAKMEFVPITPVSAPKDPGVMVITDGALFRFVGVYTATQARRAMFNQIPMVAEETWTSHSLSTKMAYTDFELEFNFIFKAKDWLLENVVLLEGGEEVGRTTMSVGARWNWAYYCGVPLVVVNTRDGSYVTISEYQIQPLRWRSARNVRLDEGEALDAPEVIATTMGSSGESFGDTVNCGPYFTVSILTGLFVTGICLIMLGYGLVILFNCNSNDRYDDPHGKSLNLFPDSHQAH